MFHGGEAPIPMMSFVAPVQTCLLLQDTGTRGTGYQRVLLGSKVCQVCQVCPSKFLAQLDWWLMTYDDLKSCDLWVEISEIASRPSTPCSYSSSQYCYESNPDSKSKLSLNKIFDASFEVPKTPSSALRSQAASQGHKVGYLGWIWVWSNSHSSVIHLDSAHK